MFLACDLFLDMISLVLNSQDLPGACFILPFFLFIRCRIHTARRVFDEPVRVSRDCVLARAPFWYT
jgi:hypothetical protein